MQIVHFVLLRTLAFFRAICQVFLIRLAVVKLAFPTQQWFLNFWEGFGGTPGSGLSLWISVSLLDIWDKRLKRNVYHVKLFGPLMGPIFIIVTQIQ